MGNLFSSSSDNSKEIAATSQQPQRRNYKAQDSGSEQMSEKRRTRKQPQRNSNPRVLFEDSNKKVYDIKRGAVKEVIRKGIEKKDSSVKPLKACLNNSNNQSAPSTRISYKSDADPKTLHRLEQLQPHMLQNDEIYLRQQTEHGSLQLYDE